MAGGMNSIAEAVREYLAGASWDLPLTVVRTHYPDLERRNLTAGATLAQVLATGFTPTAGTRGAKTRSVPVQIGLRTRTEGEDNATIDPLADLAEAISEALFQLRLGEWVCMESEVVPDPASQHEDRVYMAVVSTVWRKIA